MLYSSPPFDLGAKSPALPSPHKVSRARNRGILYATVCDMFLAAEVVRHMFMRKNPDQILMQGGRCTWENADSPFGCEVPALPPNLVSS